MAGPEGAVEGDAVGGAVDIHGMAPPGQLAMREARMVLHLRTNLNIQRTDKVGPGGTMTYIEELKEVLGPDRVLDADFDRFSYSSDFSPMGPQEAVVPDVVVMPTDTEDVVKVVQVALRHGIPITPVGGMTGMLGGALAIKGGILMATHTMGEVLEVDVVDEPLVSDHRPVLLQLRLLETDRDQ